MKNGLKAKYERFKTMLAVLLVLVAAGSIIFQLAMGFSDTFEGLISWIAVSRL